MEPTTVDPSADLSGFFKLIETAIAGRNWALLFVLGAVGSVAVLRKFAPPFFRTQIGGWLLNFLTALTGALALALTTGAAISVSTVLAAVGTAITAAGLHELFRDLLDFARAKGWLASSTPVPPPVDVSGAIPPGTTVRYLNGKGEQ